MAGDEGNPQERPGNGNLVKKKGRGRREVREAPQKDLDRRIQSSTRMVRLVPDASIGRPLAY